ncbi:hypothetical protein U4E84_09655 [Halorubrum sp. AD140]|uniref:hypothetical protein n=1 Tax=Halorubrum sp. AD140 TaxID=3050073 RepID=UPI002ACCEE9F|nr:hypothetical protein [Halorubrum sp. AD140]MDZ5811608.1 hypothetical protein [Halorubrum sp. AD140]
MSDGSGDEADRLHGEWNETGTRRWCVDCGIWVRLDDWQEHKRELAKAVTDGGRDRSSDEDDRDDLDVEEVRDVVEDPLFWLGAFVPGEPHTDEGGRSA